MSKQIELPVLGATVDKQCKDRAVAIKSAPRFDSHITAYFLNYNWHGECTPAVIAAWNGGAK
jgi:hypothetical protein